MKVSCLGLSAIASTVCARYSFAPESATEYLDPRIPALYDPATTQSTVYEGQNSYWTCSLVTASNGHQYSLINHIIFVTGTPVRGIRASILDINTNKYHTLLSDETSSDNVAYSGSPLNVVTSVNGFQAASDDSISAVHTWVDHANVNFDLTFEATSQLMLNGGLGQFNFNGIGSGEWGLPRGKTNGTITINGEVLTIDPAKSFTWYDRQWSILDTSALSSNTSSGISTSFVWFMTHFPNIGVVGSLWAVEDSTRIATFRFYNGTTVVLPFTMVTITDGQFYSNITDKYYPTKYQLQFEGGDWISVQSVRDQLIANASSSTSPSTEAFSTLKYSMFGKKGSGYGILEQAAS